MVIGAELARLVVPTLFLWGDADSFFPASRGQEVAATMPDARFEVIADAGHALQLDCPGTIATEKFLSVAETT